jgi:Family of unknown function (DUF6326)
MFAGDEMSLDDPKIPARVKLAAMWCSLMFFYVYGDYFELYQPGKLTAMLGGNSAVGPVTQGSLLGISAVMWLPSLMPVLVLVLPAPVSRWLSIVVAMLYALIVVLAIRGSWNYYMIYGAIELLLSAGIIWSAWQWPRRAD